MLIFTVVFSYVVRVPTGDIPYPLFSYAGLLPWTLLSTSISFASASLISNMNLVSKIYFPREILPLASIGAALFDFVIATVVFVVLVLFYQVPLHLTLLWLPLLLVLQILLMVGVSLGAAAVIVFFRDVRFVVPLALQLWLYATPVIYPTSLVPERWRFLYMLNPMAALVTAYRRVILEGLPPEWLSLGVASATILVILLAGYGLFKRTERLFADMI
jgi:lipopolysaccharide transport system permease protein